MNKDIVFEARIYCNRTNSQYSLMPLKKNLSKEALEAFKDISLEGFQLKVIKKLKVMQKPKCKVLKGGKK